ncbi:MAG: acyl-CoA dehydrogenase, partial [Myxococcota bacterium]
LAAWKASQPTNFFEADTDLKRGLRRHYGKERYEAIAPMLSAAGAGAAAIEPLVAEIEHRASLPRLERYDGIGRRTESVVYDHRYDDVGKQLYGCGSVSVLAEPGTMSQALVLGYINNQLGEAGHNCPIACTLGLVRALQEAGGDELKDRYLPGLLNPDYAERLDGAQFMTEVQGGSDVGANAVVARPMDDGTGRWTIHGEKWFCSNASAALFLMTARPISAGKGTGGLGLFLVPRTIDGETNHFTIRRLKEKLGTRAMASGEMDFDGCIAYPVGPVESGFKTMMNNVINTSRIANASGVLGMSRRALTIGASYAEFRRAFGAPIARFPLVQHTVADMKSEHAAMLAGHLHLAALRDRMDGDQATEEELGFWRVALNLNKYRTSVSASEVIRSALELLGGNGAIESFSAIPRMLRDNIVYENWEGTHNTLAMQVLRDMSRLGVGAPFLSNLQSRAQALVDGSAAVFVPKIQHVLTELGAALRGLADVDPGLQSLRMRPLADRMAFIMSAVAFAEQAAWETPEYGDTRAMKLLSWFWRRRLNAPLDLPNASDLDALSAISEISV